MNNTRFVRPRDIDRFIKLDGLQKESADRAEDGQIMMKLYSADLSPILPASACRSTPTALRDIVFELPEHWGMPQFRERFPIGRIPVLDVDGDMMPESEVIAEYLEEIHPQPSLLTLLRESNRSLSLERAASSRLDGRNEAYSGQTPRLRRQRAEADDPSTRN
jgi:glutathione S-transferase